MHHTHQFCVLAISAFLLLSGCDRVSSPERPIDDSMRVMSNSMAPNLPGPSLSANCQQCKHSWRIAADSWDESLSTRCYRCGCEVDISNINSHSDHDHLPPAVIRILRRSNLANETGAPVAEIQRWQRVVVYDPDLSFPQVKRVVGLPEETITLGLGEVWCNGRLVQKSLDELLGLAIPVTELSSGSDLQYLTKSTWPFGEVPIQLDWRKISQIGDLSPRKLLANPKRRLRGWISDDYECNQAYRGSLYECHDFAMTLELAINPIRNTIGNSQDNKLSDRVRIDCCYLGCNYTLVYSAADRKLKFLQDGKLVYDYSTTDETVSDVTIITAFCDGRWMTRIRTPHHSRDYTFDLADWGKPHAAESHSASPHLTSIGLSSTGGLGDTVSPESTARHQGPPEIDLRGWQLVGGSVDRDIVWRSPEGGLELWQAAEGKELAGLFLLGDNSPLSRDGRHRWPLGVPKAWVAPVTTP